MNKVFKLNVILFVTLMLGALTAILLPTKVFAGCESDGAYGETCIYEKDFKLEKKVRLEGDNLWKDKVIGVKEGQVIEFKIKIENTGEIAVDDLKMIDYLPDELTRIGGDGLTEEFSDLKVSKDKTFVIQARIKESEFDRTDNFEKCVVNKAELEEDGDVEASDTATVCYGDGEITELPETGATATQTLSIVGLISTGLGLLVKRKS